jgi:hypothetical protein
MLGGCFEYGAGFRRRFRIWRRISEADLNMEVDFGGGFEYGGGFRRRMSIWRQIFFHWGGFFSLVKARPVILCRRSSTRGVLHKSIN